MRIFAALLALSLMVGAAAARAADGGVDHVTLIEGELAPGASRVYALKFGEGPLRRGWLFALVGQVHAGTADLTLLDPVGQPAAQWRWDATAEPRWDGLTLPSDGDYRLRVTSAGEQALRYTLYYDQSCFCAGKKVPLEGGVVIFQGSAPAGAPVEAWLGMDSSIEVSLQVAYRATPAGRWPTDYQLLAVAPSSDIQDDGRFLQESITFTAVSSDPYYIIVQSRKGIGGISFLAQEGAAADTSDQARRPIWLLTIAGAAVAAALAALGMAVRARLRKTRT
ncbi:MAG: hypothetical protein ACJ8CR_03795 [Roseiflexaceae bacterium]